MKQGASFFPFYVCDITRALSTHVSLFFLLHPSSMDDDLFSSSSPGTGTATGQPMAASDPSPGPQTLANADGPSSPSSPSPTPSHHPASRPSAPPPYSPPHPPFSPSKTELESHPIRQRLSLLHPDAEAATTPEGSPPAISLELDSWPKPPAQTTEEEGHEETPDATDMADSKIQKGDAGECLRRCFLAILPAGGMASLLLGRCMPQAGILA